MLKPSPTRRHQALFFSMAALLLGAASSLPALAQTSPAQHWVSTWTMPPSSAANNQLGQVQNSTMPTQFTNQTVRQIMHTSVGGSQVQVRIANVYGTQALNIGAAHVALRDQGANVVASTDRVLTFSGQPATSIPPGAEVLSNPVALDVPQLGDLAVSIYLPDTAVPASNFLALAHQTNYLAAAGTGDTTGATSFPSAGTTTFTSYDFVTGVEVLPATDLPTIVAFGASVTEGYNSTTDANHRWPDFLKARLYAAGRLAGVVNQGLSANRLLRDNAGPSGLARFDRDVLSQPGVKFSVISDLALNDIGLPGATAPPIDEPTADDVIAGLRQLIARSHDRGIKIIGCTLPPFKNGAPGGLVTYYSAAKETIRQSVNAWIRNSAEFDGMIDTDLITRDPNDPLAINPAYDSGDHLHPNDIGYQAIGNAIDLTLFNGSVTLSSVVSRKAHGSAGPFDLPLPQGLGSSPAIESRSGGPTGDFQLVFTFAAPITSVLGAAVAEGTGSVASVALDPTHPAQVLVSLTGVTDAQYVTVGLTNVSDSLGNTSSVRATLGVLLGDVNGSGRTDNGDVIAVRNRSVQPVDATNFRFDVNLSGRIDNGDVILTRNQSVSALPAPPPQGTTP